MKSRTLSKAFSGEMVSMNDVERSAPDSSSERFHLPSARVSIIVYHRHDGCGGRRHLPSVPSPCLCQKNYWTSSYPRMPQETGQQRTLSQGGTFPLRSVGLVVSPPVLRVPSPATIGSDLAEWRRGSHPTDPTPIQAKTPYRTH